MISKTSQDCTFRKLLKSNIRIPRIQRDYVQGRNTKRISQNRESFVNALFCALEKNTVLRLNFIYGYRERNSFIPIDGQQRLTTLFLLHFYLAAKNKNEELTKELEGFTYDTRETTSDFLRKLISDKTDVTNYDNAKKKTQDFKEKHKISEQSIDEAYKSIDRLIIKPNVGDEKSLESEENRKNIQILYKYIDLLEQEKISERIKAQSWYAASWDYDPSIISCLAMLDEIEKRYTASSAPDNLATRLFSKECPIKFLIMDIEGGFGRPNDLYIKMNARGKQLTDFENMKADLFGRMHDALSDEKDFAAQFKSKMDGKWLEYIWNDIFGAKTIDGLLDERRSQAAEKYADTIYKELIHWFFMNRIALLVKETGIGKRQLNDNPELSLVYSNAVSVGVNQNGGIGDYTLSDYKLITELISKHASKDSEQAFTNLFKSILTDIENFFDFMAEIKDSETSEELKNELFNATNDNNGNFITAELRLNSIYSARVFLFAVCKYKELNGSIATFPEWYRVIRNLIYNTDIDKREFYENALESVNKITSCEFSSQYLQDSGKITFFDTYQRNEEAFKLLLITNHPTFKEHIIKAEKHPYFKGQIYFIFRLSDSSLPFEPEPDKVSTESLAKNETLFSNNLKKLEGLFDLVCRQETKEWLFHRALLTYGDYSMQSGGSRTLFFEGGNNYYNWRRMMKEKKPFSIFKEFFDDMTATTESGIEKHLQKLCEDGLKDDWKSNKYENGIYLTQDDAKFFIKHPEILSKMDQKRFIIDTSKDKPRLFCYTKSGQNGYYFQLNSFALKCEIEQELYGWKNPNKEIIEKVISYSFGIQELDSSKGRCLLKIENTSFEYANNAFFESDNPAVSMSEEDIRRIAKEKYSELCKKAKI